MERRVNGVPEIVPPGPARPIDEKLAEIPLFAALGRDGLETAVAAGLARRYGAGQIIVHQGDPGDRLFAVLEGLVKVVLTTAQGDVVVLDMLGPGETFGELSVLDGGPRSASVIVVETAWLFSVSRPQLLALMRDHPALADEFLRVLGALVRRLTERAADMVSLDLGGRLAKALLHLAAKHGESGGKVIDRAFTQSDLAAMVGASRPAVNRALAVLAARNIISINGRTIVLKNIAELHRRSVR
ncbi:Crp/Fnr family transcriptional regulator [Spirillospora sp. NPDC047279]|uniref:Crp/Fnr family transcriptional regulator n=1 Tax=Spirillospora sp. NPDC047279 TaxID=3155478 RepID=UPI0033E33932